MTQGQEAQRETNRLTSAVANLVYQRVTEDDIRSTFESALVEAKTQMAGIEEREALIAQYDQGFGASRHAA